MVGEIPTKHNCLLARTKLYCLMSGDSGILPRVLTQQWIQRRNLLFAKTTRN